MPKGTAFFIPIDFDWTFVNVLLISPDSGLPGAVAEVRQISMDLHAVVLNGYVTRKDVIEALGGHVWDVIWFACHGNEHGISLSDGAVSIADLTAIARSSGAYLVVLNSCSSRFVGLELHYELRIDVICTETAADDLSAYQTGALLARALGSGLSVTEAFAKSRPGQSNLYHLFSDGERRETEEQRMIKTLHKGFGDLRIQLDEIKSEMRQMKNEMAEMKAMQRQQDRRVESVESTTHELQRRSTSMLDRFMVLLITVAVIAMFAFNLYWDLVPR